MGVINSSLYLIELIARHLRSPAVRSAFSGFTVTWQSALAIVLTNHQDALLSCHLLISVWLNLSFAGSKVEWVGQLF